MDSHNINRQALYSKEDVGKSKVKCAEKALNERDNIETEIVTMEMNALEKWDEICKVAKECTVVFNMIDVGEYWDAAVQALCMRNNIPMVNGGTFQITLTIDYFKGPGHTCLMCLNDLEDTELKKKLSPEFIDQYSKLDFIPKAKNPIGASNIMVATTCAHMMVNSWIMDLHDQKVPTRLIFYYNIYDIDKWYVDRNENCLYCSKK